MYDNTKRNLHITSIQAGKRKTHDSGSALFSPYCILHIIICRRGSVFLRRVAQSLFKQPHPSIKLLRFFQFPLFEFLQFKALSPENPVERQHTMQEILRLQFLFYLFLILHPSCYSSCSSFIHSSMDSLSSSLILLNVHDAINVISLKLLWKHQSHV